MGPVPPATSLAGSRRQDSRGLSADLAGGCLAPEQVVEQSAALRGRAPREGCVTARPGVPHCPRPVHWAAGLVGDPVAAPSRGNSAPAPVHCRHREQCWRARSPGGGVVVPLPYGCDRAGQARAPIRSAPSPRRSAAALLSVNCRGLHTLPIDTYRMVLRTAPAHRQAPAAVPCRLAQDQRAAPAPPERAALSAARLAPRM
jgi:hypothetical protein